MRGPVKRSWNGDLNIPIAHALQWVDSLQSLHNLRHAAADTPWESGDKRGLTSELGLLLVNITRTSCVIPRNS